MLEGIHCVQASFGSCAECWRGTPCRLFRLLEALPGAAPRAVAFSSAEGPAARAAALSSFQVGSSVHQTLSWFGIHRLGQLPAHVTAVMSMASGAFTDALASGVRLWGSTSCQE